jgi:hypothetical protein
MLGSSPQATEWRSVVHSHVGILARELLEHLVEPVDTVLEALVVQRQVLH